ncbi:AraC family transcriptional regulator [Nocardia niigatensis]
MSVIRGTALSGYCPLVAELGADPAELLRGAGIRTEDVGNGETFLPFRRVVHAVEIAAARLGVPDFGRRLAQRQGIEILGPVGVAARTAGSVSDAFAVFDTYVAAYSPAIVTHIAPFDDDPARSLFEFRILVDDLPPHPQVIELALGTVLRVLRFLLGAAYTPLAVRLPHDPLTTPDTYLQYFGATPYFAQRSAGFTIATADLARPLARDELAHQAVVRYLDMIVGGREPGVTGSVREIVRQLLPTGTVPLELIAGQFALHPKALQRRLVAEGTTYATLVDTVRRETAERYLRDTDISLTHLTRELGYTEQSALSRACRRWFGQGPAAHRRTLRTPPPPVDLT